MLTEAVRRRPYQVVLFDEVEKAHGDVFNILLQVLDDGRLTDGQGRTVDFTNTLIILTSNLGSQYLSQPAPTTQKVESVEPQVMEVVRAHFRPGIPQPARRDHPVPPARARRIWARSSTSRSAASRSCSKDRKIALELTDGARAWLGRVGYDPVYGARPLKRAVQKYLQDPLADVILRGEVPDGSTVQVDEGDGALKLSVAAAAPRRSHGQPLARARTAACRATWWRETAPAGPASARSADRRQVEPELGRRLAEREPAGRRRPALGFVRQRDIEGRAEPALRVDMAAWWPRAGQPHRPGAGEADRPVAARRSSRMGRIRRRQLRDMRSTAATIAARSARDLRLVTRRRGRRRSGCRRAPTGRAAGPRAVQRPQALGKRVEGPGRRRS